MAIVDKAINLTELYRRANMVRSKLMKEAGREDLRLRFLVTQANCLDALMIKLDQLKDSFEDNTLGELPYTDGEAEAFDDSQNDTESDNDSDEDDLEARSETKKLLLAHWPSRTPAQAEILAPAEMKPEEHLTEASHTVKQQSLSPVLTGIIEFPEDDLHPTPSDSAGIVHQVVECISSVELDLQARMANSTPKHSGDRHRSAAGHEGPGFGGGYMMDKHEPPLVTVA